MSSVIELLVNERSNASFQSDAPTPLYHQMYMMLKNNIMNGRIAQGTQMPTEQQLAESFSVSRITAKRAMDELAAEELVERRRGKGTHVTYKYIQKPVQAPLVGMLENLESMGRNTRIRVLDVASTIPPADIRAELGLEDDEKVHRVIRVRSSKDGIPFAFYTSWTKGISKDFTKRKLETLPRLEILRLNGLSLARIEQTLGAELADADVANELDMQQGDPLLTLVRRSYDDNDKLVDILNGQYNPQRFQYQMTLSVDDDKIV